MKQAALVSFALLIWGKITDLSMLSVFFTKTNSTNACDLFVEANQRIPNKMITRPFHLLCAAVTPRQQKAMLILCLAKMKLCSAAVSLLSLIHI